MTDYPGTRTGWRRRQVQAKWQNLIAIFITVVLLLAVFNGLLRGFSQDLSFRKSSWIRGSPLVIAVNSSPGSLVIYQDDQKNLALLTFDEEDYFATLDGEIPIVKLGKVFEKNDKTLAFKVSGALHLPVGHFVVFKERPSAKRENFEDYFKNFASLLTPFGILFNYPGDSVAYTNLTRVDLFRLWWGLKSYRVENLIFKDLGDLGSETILENGQKVEVVDEQLIARAVSIYLESERLSSERFSVFIKNSSGIVGAGQLASEIMSISGAHVVKIETDSAVSATSHILAGDTGSFTANYLAKLVGCDIKAADDLPDEAINVIIGRDFVEKYLF